VKVTVEFVTVPREGERDNGDAAVVRRSDETVLIAVIDALGHGRHAAEAAAVGTRYLEEAPLHGGIRRVVEELHERLRGTRGAAAMLLLIKDNKLEGCGVGNVGLRSFRARIPAMLTPGVLGGSITRLRLFQSEVGAGDRIILFSDGISSRFDDESARGAPAIVTCKAIMDRYRKPHDDATVLVTDIEALPAPAQPGRLPAPAEPGR
jgi:negative regulator of sigma-B (phosphoserine phosphatase)